MTKIKGTGSILPANIITNSHFHNHSFYDKNGVQNSKSGAEMAAKLEAITGIRERRYIPSDQDSVPLLTEGARRAVADARLDVNDIDGIIVAHNAGNMITEGGFQTVPNLAALLKNALECTNHECFAYDILFGCPGWLQGMIQAHQAISCGDASHVLVVGLEVASRQLDPCDLDSMILADGCGACVLTKNDVQNSGILSYATFSHAQEDVRIIYLDKSNNAKVAGNCYFHMNGKEVYKYATQWVPKVIKKALDKANLGIEDVDMFLFHQANEKLLEAIGKNLTHLYKVPTSILDGKVPATIQFLGNTSVATIPTMLDMILKNSLGDFKIEKGQTVVFASVGAGMHCNAVVYRF
jgi:3-oxoacyl-[acyl-carrier-protein] synthase III